MRQLVLVGLASTYVRIRVVDGRRILWRLPSTLLFRMLLGLTIVELLGIQRKRTLALSHHVLFQIGLLKRGIGLRKWLGIDCSGRLRHELVSGDGVGRRYSANVLCRVVVKSSDPRVLPDRRGLRLHCRSKSLSRNGSTIGARCSGVGPTPTSRIATSSPGACPRRRSVSLPRSSLAFIGHRLESTVLLLFLKLNVSWISVRPFVVLLRPFIHISLRLMLRTLIVNLRLKHASLLVRHPVLKHLLLRRLYRILPVLIKVRELLVDRDHLVIEYAKRLPIDQTLDSRQLLKN